MAYPVLVIVNGPPGAGKTVLGRRLAHEFMLPFLSKDDIKECLFNFLGWSDRNWSMKLGRASMELLFQLIETQLAAGQSLLVETVFHPAYHNERFRTLIARYPFEPVQVYCTCADEILYVRFRQRIETGERHAGHVDGIMGFDEFKATLGADRQRILDIGSALIQVDTTDFSQVDFNGLRAAVATHLNSAQQ
jgi:predicted kinase